MSFPLQLTHIFVFCFLRSFTQNFDTVCLQQQLVIHAIKSQHFSPPEFNATTNTEILSVFIRDSDEKNLFFLEPDQEDLADMIEKNPGTNIHCELLRSSFRLMNRRLVTLDSLLDIVENSAMNFSNRDTIHFSYHKRERKYCKDLSELHERIHKRIKYETLVAISASEDYEALRHEGSAVMQPIIQKASKRSISRLRQFLSRYRNENFLLHHLADNMSNAIAQRCDPHSNFFNSHQAESYNNAIHMDETSFGFSVSEDESGNVIVSALTPGGPAWKSNDLNEDDIILSFNFGNGQEIHIDQNSLDFFRENFYGAASDSVELKVRKKDRKVKTVRLKKEKIQPQQSMLNSYVVRVDAVNMGYIPIPAFYLDSEADSRHGCANDVASEIIELRQDSIKGIILDLRYNGGGSMREAMALAGIFIEEGPVAIYRPRNAQPFVLKDLNRGTIWDGPLVILVNGASASASEFVTATLKDYNRAVVAGSPTFGKGTAQSLIMTDSSFNSGRQSQGGKSPFGYMKITTGKFYSPSARSHQGVGINPDVPIPGIIEKVMDKEGASQFVLAGDSLRYNARYRKLRPLPVKELQKRSKGRVSTDTQFARIIALGDSLQRVRHLPEKVALTPSDFKSYTQRQQLFYHLVESASIDTKNTGISIRNNSQNDKIIRLSDYQARSNEEALVTLRRDLILHETVFILKDLIDLSDPHK